MPWQDDKIAKSAPCKDCEKRHPGCHAECHLYQSYAESRRQANARRMSEKELDNTIMESRLQGMERTGYWRKKRYGRKGK